MVTDDPLGLDLARRIYDYGVTPDDLGPRLHGRTEGAKARASLGLKWPSGLAPTPRELAQEPDPNDPLPRADVLIVTWTAAELLGLADTLTPGVNPRTRWYRYARHFESYLPEIRPGAPARVAGRLGSYYPITIGSKKVLCVKSELHLNQDGVKTGAGTATLPVARFIEQMYDEVRPKLVLTVGTAGGTLPDAELGDVMITRAVKFRCTNEFAHEPFNHRTYVSPATIKRKHLDAATALMATHAAQLTEPDFGPPTEFYDFPGPNLPGHVNTPSILLEGRDFPKGLPMLTTDYFEFGTSTNGLDQLGCGVEMGDAVFGLVGERRGADGPKWLVIRNASDPRINGKLPTGPPMAVNMQAHWAVWFYEAFGYWTSVNSAIAAWSQVAA
jgi:nucleoside phosphorylase